MIAQPTPFVVFREGTYLHGTKAQLAPGDLLTPGYSSNFEAGRTSRHVYITETLDAAAWGAELSMGNEPGRIYVVEPTPRDTRCGVREKRLARHISAASSPQTPPLILQLPKSAR